MKLKIKLTLLTIAMLILIYFGVTPKYVLADGTEPMPACRHKVCPPVDNQVKKP